MTLERQIREAIADYLYEERPLDEVMVEITKATWGESADESADRFAARVKRYVAEFTNGDRTEDELRSLLADELTHVSTSSAEIHYSASADNDQIGVSQGQVTRTFAGAGK